MLEYPNEIFENGFISFEMLEFFIFSKFGPLNNNIWNIELKQTQWVR